MTTLVLVSGTSPVSFIVSSAEIIYFLFPDVGVVSYSSMSRDHTRDRAGDQLGLGRLHAHVCRIITCLSESISIESDPPYPSEEKYKPFLLEFAALKYSFDKFSDIVYGYPVRWLH